MNDTPVKPKSDRLVSLDAYRGFTMLLLVSGGFGIGRTASRAKALFEEGTFGYDACESLAYQFSHVDWHSFGCSLWDMIQPSFMFLVGTSMIYSYTKRTARGDSYNRQLGHAIFRAIFLVLLGVFLRSKSTPSTYWTFEDVVSQIGLGYVFLFLLWDKKPKIQVSVAVLILFGYWLLFALSPIPESIENQSFADHWNRGHNAANHFDIWLFGMLPEPVRHVAANHDYTTLNFIPSLATMIFGLVSGGILISKRTGREKLAILASAGLLLIIWAIVIDYAGFCPIVKKIWTPSWALFSSGWAMLILAAFYGIVDVAGYQRWTYPGRVFGANSIAAYVMGGLMGAWIGAMITTHTKAFAYFITKARVEEMPAELPSIYQVLFGETLEPMFAKTAVFLVMFGILLWMYRRKIFIRI